MSSFNAQKIQKIEDRVRLNLCSYKLTLCKAKYKVIAKYLEDTQPTSTSQFEKKLYNIVLIAKINAAVKSLHKENILDCNDRENFKRYCAETRNDPGKTLCLFCLHLEQEHRKPHLFKEKSGTFDKEFSNL